MNSRADIGNDLLDAASKGALDDMKRLIANGANPEFRDVFDGGTCLHRSVGNGHLSATQLLLACGANPNIVTIDTSTSPLGVAAWAGNHALVDLLLAANARLSTDEIATGLLSECRELGFDEIANAIEAVSSSK